MKTKWNIAGGMRQVETNDAPAALPRLRDNWHVEELACSVVHTAKKDRSIKASMSSSRMQDSPERGVSSRSEIDGSNP